MGPPPVLGIAAEASSKQDVQRVLQETMQAATAYADEASTALQGTPWSDVAITRMLPLRVAVGCSGVPADGLAMRQSEAEARLAIDSSLMAGLWLTQEAATAMRRTGGGSVVLVGSAAHLRPRPGQSAYAAAKAGLEGVARAAACELGRFGVRVNVCAPGFIAAGMTLSSITEAEQLAIAQRSPLRRLGTPADVAAAVDFLASPHDGLLLGRDPGPGASFITGQSLVVDGGISTSGL